MVQQPRDAGNDVLDHLLVLQQLRDKSRHIYRKIEEVTARLQHARQSTRYSTAALDLAFPRRNGDDHAQSVLAALKELDEMLGQPDLITRDELRSHLQELLRKLDDERGG